ncbi:MAG: hypothetical protein EBZ48_00750, partial [Proteobacteria bacterium]|nr:hypothetical protein [Pseudomonadota bacterium]
MRHHAILLLVLALVQVGCSGVQRTDLKSQPVKMVMMCHGEGYGQGTLLSADTLLLTSHQLRDKEGQLQEQGFIYVGGEPRHFVVTARSPRSELTILRIEPGINVPSGVTPWYDRTVPITEGTRAYLVCFQPPDKDPDSFQSLLHQCDELRIIPGTIEGAVEIPGDPGNLLFVPAKGFDWVKLAPGISGAPVFIIDPKKGAMIIGVNSH